MPYSSLAEARIKKLNGVPLTLEQVNLIATWADAIGEDGWPIAISKFKKSYKADGGKWVAAKAKELTMFIQKEDRRYKITTVSTAAIRDAEGETFTVEAIDYDIARAKETGVYPEYRVFHSPLLGIGRVTEMRRVGIFSVETGYSYTDPFSLRVCKDMLSKNDGRWRVSRGFLVLEGEGTCPKCSKHLRVVSKNLLMGSYRCPNCQSVHSNVGVLKETKYHKAITFELSITDRPCVSSTGAMASLDQNLEAIMTKEQLRARLKEAGLPDDLIEARLSDFSDAKIKELSANDDIPYAILKEFAGDDFDIVEVGDDNDNAGGELVVDDAVMKELTASVGDKLESLFAGGLEIDIPDAKLELKEMKVITDLSAKLDALSAKLDAILGAGKEKELSRGGKLRVVRYKSTKAAAIAADGDDEDTEDTADEEDMMDEEEMPMPRNKKKVTKEQSGVIPGTEAHSLTEFMLGGNNG